MKENTRIHDPINPKFPRLLHGGDSNPEQWLSTPKIIDEDFRLMKLARCNAMSVGIFSWTALEPEDGRYEFGWLDGIMDRLAENGLYAMLATPSGARPAWMSRKYPEVLRVQADRRRILHGQRHNHCYTSPVYREKCAAIAERLVRRYKDHPALLVWHVSNEYGGECHCPLCQEAFRSWLKTRYENDLDKLNKAWWTAFWSHTYTDWIQIESPAPHGETSIHGLVLDWKRFVTRQTVDFFRAESEPLRKITPGVPVTVNMMGTYPGLDYRKFAPFIDVASWDNYPAWGTDRMTTGDLASDVAFVHDLYRSLKGGKPWMLMESTPSLVNWQQTNKLKPAGLHFLSSMQALAHGSDTVQYFQWRKSRGSTEKFHGAVVDHIGHENARVFREVAEVGAAIGKLDGIAGSATEPEVAVIFDWENGWAIDGLSGLKRENRDYERTCRDHYRAFWRRGVAVDVIDEDGDFSAYKLIAAPMLYMVRPGVGERLAEFVKQGGTLVTTYLTGYVDDTDLCFLGGFPGPLRQVTGIWAEEIDSLYDADRNSVIPVDGSLMSGEYEVFHFCELIHAEGAEILARYGKDWYAGRPALTHNRYGKGNSWHVAARTERRFLHDLYGAVLRETGIQGVLGTGTELPEGVSVQERSNGKESFLFVMNFNEHPVDVELGDGPRFDMLGGTEVKGTLSLDRYGFAALKRSSGA
jgi:beta-galactosidase